MGGNCGGCAAAKARRAVNQQAQGKSTGNWSLTMLNGDRTFYDNRLAAMAANVALGGGGMVRQVT